jgi:hypothetical protein
MASWHRMRRNSPGDCPGRPSHRGPAGGARSTPARSEVAEKKPVPNPKPRLRSTYLWAWLLARIYEVFPLLCPHCREPMTLLAFVTDAGPIQRIQRSAFLLRLAVGAHHPRRARSPGKSLAGCNPALRSPCFAGARPCAIRGLGARQHEAPLELRVHLPRPPDLFLIPAHPRTHR